MPPEDSSKRRANNPPSDWKKWINISIRIDGLPTDVTAENLLEWFSHEGNIAFYNFVPASVDGNSESLSAIINFEPVPSCAFWEAGFTIVHHPDTVEYPEGLQVQLSVQARPERWYTSRIHPDMQYPTRITAALRSMDFGSMIGPTSLNIRKSITPPDGTNNLSLEVDVLSKRLVIYFSILTKVSEGHYNTQEFKLLAELSQIKTIFHVATEEDRETLILPFPLPPQYFCKKHDLQQNLLTARGLGWRYSDGWSRATDIVEDSTTLLNFPISVNNNIPNIGYLDVGRWTAFRVVLNTTEESEKQAIRYLKLALEDLNINLQVCNQFHIVNSTATMWDYLDHRQVEGEEHALALLQPLKTPFVHLDFGVRYQLEVCISRRMLNEHSVCLLFLQRLAALDPLDAKHRLELLVDRGEVMYDPMDLFTWEAAASYVPNAKIPHYCVLARKASITPTTILLGSPTIETSNRVLRYFNHIQDRFLRVQFVEETENGRIAASCRNKEEIWKKLLRTLYQGIQIGDRRYEFLAFGSSQLRQCGAYFFCPTDHISSEDIRRWMGEVGHIRIVAKYAARLGQCFSTTREMKGIPVPDVRSIPDIQRNGYCFTDGVGMISEFMARMIIEELALDVYNDPSAFQFRMGGCKGVLVVWPQAKRGEVYIRESQEKFKAEVKSLEIIKCAKYSSATLNRQTITILQCLGVPTQAFMNILEKQLCLYEEATKNNLVAVDILTKCVDENQSTLILAEFLQAGFKTEKLQEPFVTNLLSLWRSWSLKLLKDKARIPIEQSAFVLGCVDETGTLRGHSNATEGTSDKDINKLPQIFLQVSDSKVYDKVNVVRGICVVGRNPSLHPGDIRVVEAVDIPELHHLRDIVVFPSTGDRPVPNMLSGGDLDGDDFFVIWEPSLIPQEWNHPAMNYSSPSPQKLDRDVNADDLRDFFVKYMKNDVLPLIATAHLALADHSGPKTSICLHLAELHSQAVDYPKTGEPAEWNAAAHNPQQWPHFMEKRHSYKSKKALGEIYDRVIKQSIQFRPDWDHAFDQRILDRFQLDNAMLRDARKIKGQYDTTVRRILSQHNLGTEFELYTSWAMSKPPIGSEYKRQEELGQEFGAVKQRFREICFEAAGGHDEAKIDRFVAAMYKITEQEVKIALFEHHRGPTNNAGVLIPPRKLEAKSMPLISFPWIFPWVMIRIASEGNFNPKRSILAAAHRQVLVSVPPTTQTEQTAHAIKSEAKTEKGNLSDGQDNILVNFDEEEVSQNLEALGQFEDFNQF
ncbi:RNA dependent RNA polymerase domain-containing protein [Trichoderma ceciliae]